VEALHRAYTIISGERRACPGGHRRVAQRMSIFARLGPVVFGQDGPPGQPLDPATGLMYYRARWYDPALGRFVSADTVVPGAGEPQALNRYSYVGGNPLRFVDPTGHRLTDPLDPEHDPTIRRHRYETVAVHLSHNLPLYYQLDYANGVNACGPTSLAMVLDYNSENPIGAQAVINYAIEERLYDPTGGAYDPAYTSPDHLYQLAQHYGTPRRGWVRLDDSQDAQEKLRALLRLDLPAIVDVTVYIAPKSGIIAAHYVVVTGIDADGTVYVNDPYGDGNGAVRRKVPWEDFYWAWRSNDDEPYGGHGWWMVLLPESRDR